MTQELTRKGGLWRFVSMIALAIALIAASLVGTSALAATDDEGKDFSFYSLSSSLSTYGSDSLSPDGEGIGQHFDRVARNGGMAGGMLGYQDADSGGWGWMSGNLTAGSSKYDYNFFSKASNENGDDVSTGFKTYMYYGASLADLGIDKTTGGGMMDGMLRLPEAIIMTVIYSLYLAGALVFSLVINLLQMLNPFQFFYQAIESLYPSLAHSMMGGAHDPNMNGFQRAISDMVYSVVVLAHNLGSLILVVFVGVFLVSLVFWNSSKRLHGLKRILIRMAFLVVGVPMLGGLYTASLSALEHTSNSASDAGSISILQTYVDFGSWANNTRLMPPQAFGGGRCANAVIEWDAVNNSVTEKTQVGLDNIAYCINANSIGKDSQSALTVSIDNLTPGTTGPVRGTTEVDSNVALVYKLLWDYGLGHTVSGASYESAFKGSLTNYLTDKDAETKTKVSDWFNQLNTADKVKDVGAKDDSDGDITSTDSENMETISGNPLITLPEGAGLNSTVSGDVWTFGVQSGTNACYGQAAIAVDVNGKAPACTLSPLSLYNFMNSSFASEDVTVYSVERSISSFTRENHYSVVKAGHGALTFLKSINTGVELIAYGLLGIIMSVGLLFSSIRRFIQLVMSIPFGLLGFIGGIAKAIVYTLALIAELFGTLIAYGIVTELLRMLIAIPRNMMLAVTGDTQTMLMDGIVALLTVVSAKVMMPILLMLSIIFIVAFIFVSVRVRKQLISALEQGITNLNNRFLGTGIAPPASGKNPAARVASGARRLVAAGAEGAISGGGKALVNRVASAGGPALAGASGIGPQTVSYLGDGPDGSGSSFSSGGPGSDPDKGGPGSGDLVRMSPAERAKAEAEAVARRGGLSHGEAEPERETGELEAGAERRALEKPVDDAGTRPSTSQTVNEFEGAETEMGQQADERMASAGDSATEAVKHGAGAVAAGAAKNPVGAVTEGAEAVKHAKDAVAQSGEGTVDKVVDASGVYDDAEGGLNRQDANQALERVDGKGNLAEGTTAAVAAAQNDAGSAVEYEREPNSVTQNVEQDVESGSQTSGGVDAARAVEPASTRGAEGTDAARLAGAGAAGAQETETRQKQTLKPEAQQGTGHEESSQTRQSQTGTRVAVEPTAGDKRASAATSASATDAGQKGSDPVTGRGLEVQKGAETARDVATRTGSGQVAAAAGLGAAASAAVTSATTGREAGKGALGQNATRTGQKTTEAVNRATGTAAGQTAGVGTSAGTTGGTERGTGQSATRTGQKGTSALGAARGEVRRPVSAEGNRAGAQGVSASATRPGAQKSSTGSQKQAVTGLAARAAGSRLSAAPARQASATGAGARGTGTQTPGVARGQGSVTPAAGARPVVGAAGSTRGASGAGRSQRSAGVSRPQARGARGVTPTVIVAAGQKARVQGTVAGSSRAQTQPKAQPKTPSIKVTPKVVAQATQGSSARTGRKTKRKAQGQAQGSNPAGSQKATQPQATPRKIQPRRR